MKKLMTLLALATLCVACAKHDPLHEAMESMGDSFKAMRETSDLTEFQSQWQSFKEAVAIAEAETMGPEEQADFEQGMDKLTQALPLVDAALAAGDLEAAKAVLKDMGAVRKEYHDKLKVD